MGAQIRSAVWAALRVVWCGCAAVCVAATAPAAAPAALDTIYVAIAPLDTVVTPGATFDVHFVVTQPGLGFNAYDAVIGYEPAALTLVGQPASWQQGSLMTGACGNTFHRFTAGGDSVVINHSLLCAGVSLHGPGTLYNLRFLASATPQPTHVTLRFIQFYDDGMERGPVKVRPNTIHVGAPVDGALPAVSPAIPLQVTPNPFNPNTQIHVEFPSPGAHNVSVFDATGRLVRALSAGTGRAGPWVLDWDGRDGSGHPAAAGVYFVRARAGRSQASVRAVLLK